MTGPQARALAPLAVPLVIALAPAVTAFYADNDKKSCLEWATALVEDVRSEDTSYTHDAPVVRWKGVDGAEKAECRTDCSGLMDALIKRTYGYRDDDFKAWLGRKRPLAKTYHDAIVDGNRFKQIERLPDVKPGDVIAIKYRADDPENKGGDTGHVMIVAEKPDPHRGAKPISEKRLEWEVTVIDECNSYHGKTDTRYHEDGRKGGVGRGVFRIYTDMDGLVVGHTWSVSAASDFRDQDDRHLVIGRLDP